MRNYAFRRLGVDEVKHMTKERAIKKLYEIMRQYELSIVDGVGAYADKSAKAALKNNKDSVEALKMAIKALN